MLRGTLERVPRTPQNFSRIFYWWGWGGGAERGLAPGGGLAPARHWLGGALAVPGGGLAFFVACLPCRRRTRRGLNPCGTGSLCPGGEDHLKRRSSSPPVPPLLGCRHCSPEPRLNCHAPAGYRNATPSPTSQGAKPHSGHLLGRLRKCRKRFNARGAGGGASGEINFGSPPSPPGKGDRGQDSKLKAG